MPAGDGGVAHALFVSKDRRIPKIRIQTRQLGNLLNKRIVVTVDSWDRLSRYPSGHYVRTIGEIGDRDTESEVLNDAFFFFHACFWFCVLLIVFGFMDKKFGVSDLNFHIVSTDLSKRKKEELALCSTESEREYYIFSSFNVCVGCID